MDGWGRQVKNLRWLRKEQPSIGEELHQHCGGWLEWTTRICGGMECYYEQIWTPGGPSSTHMLMILSVWEQHCGKCSNLQARTTELGPPNAHIICSSYYLFKPAATTLLQFFTNWWLLFSQPSQVLKLSHLSNHFGVHFILSAQVNTLREMNEDQTNNRFCTESHPPMETGRVAKQLTFTLRMFMLLRRPGN